MSNCSGGGSEYVATVAISERSVTMNELYELCTSDNLSLGTLKEKEFGPPSNYADCKYARLCVHQACINRNITLEIIQYLLLDIFPDAPKEMSTAGTFSEESKISLLHLCCSNENCPDEIIRWLLQQFPSAINEFSFVINGENKIYGVETDIYRGNMNIQGLPIHYYLARESNVDLETVELLVGAYPQALLANGNNVRVAPIHIASTNSHIDNLLEIILYLLKSEPTSIWLRDSADKTILALTCGNGKPDKAIFQLIYNSWPEALRLGGDDHGQLPIHKLCDNKDLDDTASLDILRFMLEIDPNLPMEMDRDDYLPVHYAVTRKSTAFGKILIDAHPQSLRIELSDGLPIHIACFYGERDDTVDTIQYMLELDPELIHAEDSGGWLPIHCAAMNGTTKSIELLLKLDPDAASKEINNGSRRLPLHLACKWSDLSTVQALYDAYPEAILARDSGGDTPLDIASKQPVLDFLQTQLVYAQQAQDMTAMTTLDDDGWLPLHRSLKDDAPLGSIKLLKRANPASVQVSDQNGAYPVHIACKFSSVKVVKYFVKLDGDTLNNVDANNNSLLHYACRGGNCDVVKYLLDANVPSVSEINNDEKLAINLLFECGENILDRDSLEYIETVKQLLLANPEVVRDLMSNRLRQKEIATTNAKIDTKSKKWPWDSLFSSACEFAQEVSIWVILLSLLCGYFFSTNQEM